MAFDVMGVVIVACGSLCVAAMGRLSIGQIFFFLETCFLDLTIGLVVVLITVFGEIVVSFF